jgi:MarR family 2-MHQ and catechol resistance regulon transcriptional repressor
MKPSDNHHSHPVPTGVHVWLVLWKAARALEVQALRSIEVLDMGLSDFGVLEALLHKGPLPVHVLGAKVLLTSGSITTAVDRLERRGLVQRSSDPADRRACLVGLTESGRKVIRRAFAEHAKHMEIAASAISPGERATLVPLLRKLGQPGRGQECRSGRTGKKIGTTRGKKEKQCRKLKRY